MEQERIAAGVRKDADALEPVTEDACAQFDFNGALLDRAATFDRSRASGIHLRSNAVSDIAVRICGDMAVVTRMAHPRGALEGEEFSPDIRYSGLHLRPRRPIARDPVSANAHFAVNS
jgi:hypothetical protein